jgi:hypothetical protein
MIISLGWNCDPAVMTTELGMRNKKIDGYMTCPFDLMISNYEGLCECIRDNFKYFVDTNYLTLRDDQWIVNTKYNFIFNHEASIYFSENNFAKFIERYSRRITNFNNYIRQNNIIFVHQRYNSLSLELDEILHEAYPELKYKIACITQSSCFYGVSKNEKKDMLMTKQTINEFLRFDNSLIDNNLRKGRCINVVDYSVLVMMFDTIKNELF